MCSSIPKYITYFSCRYPFVYMLLASYIGLIYVHTSDGSLLDVSNMYFVMCSLAPYIGLLYFVLCI